ncbi:MAG: peptide/nickel transport system permease protein [Myxococcota bacterium]
MSLPWQYIAKKLLLTIPLLWGVVTLTFVLVELSPGTIVDKFVTPETTPEHRELLMAAFGLNEPVWWRYLLMLRNLATFEFGISLSKHQPVFDLIRTALPSTLQLTTVTLAVTYPAGILIGVVQSIRHNRISDIGLSVSSLALYSMPTFWLALMLQLFAATWWMDGVEWLDQLGVVGDEALFWLELPISGKCDPIYCDDFTPLEYTADVSRHLLLPGVAMGLASAAGTARYMRSSLLEVLNTDYVRTARAKGLRPAVVVGRHALRNALLPICTLVGLTIPYLFSGSVIVELVFGWPGMGRLIVEAIYAQDVPLIIACFYVFTLFVVAGNLLADIAYGLLDPRVRLT